MPEDIEIIKLLTQRLQYGECVLFLGPDLLVNEAGVPVSNAFSLSLCKEMDACSIEYDESQAENLFYTSGRYIRGMNGYYKKNNQSEEVSEKTLRDRYSLMLQEQGQANELLAALSDLPFYLTINTNPDRKMHELMARKIAPRKCHFGFYDYTQKNNEAQMKEPREINSENFVVYNVYGYYPSDRRLSQQPLDRVDRMRPVILTELEFIEFSSTIHFAGNGIPEVIRNFITGKCICLFAGFRFSQWYLKILLKALGFSGNTPGKNYSVLSNHGQNHYYHFYSDELRFAFLNADYGAFIRQLRNYYAETVQNQNREITRAPQNPVGIVYISDLKEGNDDAKKDRKIGAKIAANLMDLERKGYINQWSESKLMAGSDREKALEERFSKADLYIVLASELLLAADDDNRIERALQEVNGNSGKKIIPVYCRHCLYDQFGFDEESWLPLNNSGVLEPVLKMGTEEDEKIKSIANYIYSEVMQILQQRN